MNLYAPTVSVIIPVRNGERYIAEAIASIDAQIYANTEIIVVDDGSTDRTRDVVRRRADIIYFGQPASGQSVARNVGAEQARGEFLTFLDADDLWTAGKTARQLDRFRTSPELAAVFGHAVNFKERDGDGGAIALSPPVLAHLPGAMMIRRQAFFQIGGYSAEWPVGEVVEWYARALDAKLPMFTIDDVVLERRIHDSNLGIRTENPSVSYLGIVRSVIARRRKVE